MSYDHEPLPEPESGPVRATRQTVPDRSTGEALDPAAARDLGERFGADFSAVRVHTGPDAGRSAAEARAAAYTVGEDIVFAAGRYAPRTGPGRQLLTHELAHVVQQRAGAGAQSVDRGGVRAAPVDDTDEGYAHRATEAVRTGRRPDPPSTPPRPGPRLQRSPDVPETPRRDEVARELAALKLRLGAARAQEAATSTSRADVPALEAELGWKEKLAAEPDTTKQRIIFLRAQLRQLKQRLVVAPPSSERDRLSETIHAHELALATALETNIARLSAEALRLRDAMAGAADPGASQTLLTVEAELLDNTADLAFLRRVFAPATAPAVAAKYRNEVRPLPGGGCMTAVYKGLEALYTPQTSTEIRTTVQADAARILAQTRRDTNHVDRIMETVRARGLAGPVNPVRYDRRQGAWVPTVERTVLNLVRADYPGWYFFGLSVSGAYHSVIVAVDNSSGGAPQVYWLDQYSKGFTKNVTGKLDATMKTYEPSYGYTDSKVWALLPAPDTVIPVP
ncbi:MAG TPA: DUF4157 domain-containing protein [Micromonosporaceae bacterium]|nr:DUF4157 domain-containing protein [Micromonosporaceae bacterium]